MYCTARYSGELIDINGEDSIKVRFEDDDLSFFNFTGHLPKKVFFKLKSR